MSIRQALEHSRLFQGTPEVALNMAAEAAQERRFAAGQTIFREDDPGEAVYLITAGRVKITRANLEGRERIFTILTPPEVLGEMALVSNQPRTATAYCLDAVSTVALYSEDLRRILDRFPAVLWRLAGVMASRLAEMNREVEMLSFASTQSNVAYALHSLYLKGAFVPGPEGRPSIAFTHQDLANRTGNSRETITRVLREFETEKLIRTKPGLITLLEPDALEEVIYGLRERD